MKKQLYSLLPFFLTCTIFGNALSCNAATEDTDKKTTITFMDTGTGDYATQYKESLEAILLEDFPDIEIEVEAVLEDYVSQKIGGALFSVHYITQQMQTAYDLG